MNIPIRLRNVFVFAFLMVSMLIPAKMGMGQKFNSWKTIEGRGSGPFAVVVDKSGAVYISEDGLVYSINKDGLVNILAERGPLLGEIFSAYGLAIDEQGSLWMADFMNHQLVIRNRLGDFEFIGGLGESPGKFRDPAALAFNSKGQLWVVDHGNRRIQVRDLQNQWSTYGGALTGMFYYPFDLALSQTDEVWVADTGNGRIMKRDVNGVWSVIGSPGIEPGQFNAPMGIAVDYMGRIWVSERGNGRLQVRNLDGSWTIVGTKGFGVGQFIEPNKLCFGPDGRIYVTDPLLNHIATFFPDYPDSVSPTSSLNIGNSSLWSNQPINVTVSSVDDYGSRGVKEIHYSLNMGTEQVVTGSSASLTLTDNGVHSIAYYAIDIAGNIETTQYATVRIDKTRPTVDAYSIGSLVTVIAQDTFSGVASTKVSIDGAAAVDYTGSFSVPVGAHTVTYWATDQAGNESTREVILVGVTVSSVVVAPTTLFSTKAGVGTVKLSLAAPAGGVVVMLDSNSPTVTVPVSVTVPAGALTATFPVTAGTVSTDTKAVISASVGGQEVHGTVYVLVPYPKTLTLAPTTIIGGDAGVGTITLVSNAGAGGQVVNLASSNSNVVVPSSVTVPSGATTVTFPIQTSIVVNDIAVAISAEADGAGISSTLLVKRVAPKSITFAPASVIGGNSSVATLTVTKPAPAGGIVVDLRSVSSNVTVPATVTVPAGATTATFPVTTVPVKKSESAMIQAYAAGVKVSANITVTATSVVSIALNPMTVVGGLNSTATVTLNGVAPVGGTTVQVYSTNANASVPVSVTVPSGTKTVTFPVTTVAVAANTTASIAAKYLGITKSATLTIAAPTVSTLILLPSNLKGGTTSKLTIKLTGKAGIGGVLVTLTSSNTVVAQIPATVIVPAGADTVDVNIQTSAVAATTNVTLTAKTGAVAKTAVLTVNK